MKIRLSEIPEEGREYVLNRAGGELDANLEGLTDKNYQLKARLFPVVQHFQLTGKFETSVSDVCSQCGDDFELAIKRSFQEILMEKTELPRSGHYARSGLSDEVTESDEAIDVTNFENGFFDLGEYTRQVLALAIPAYPLCGDGQCLNWQEAQALLNKINQEAQIFDAATPQSPFEQLRSLKVSKPE